MNDMNELAKYLEMYDQQIGKANYRPPVYGSMGSDISSRSGEGRPGMLWAQQQMRNAQMRDRQQKPDFFGGGQGMQGQQQAPQYIHPQQAQMPQPGKFSAVDPRLQQGTQNFLARLLGA